MGENLVEVRNMTKAFGDLLVLDNVTFDVKKGEFLCVVGPTGCGKTTFLRCLTGATGLTGGSITMDGEKVDLRKHNIAYIMQEYSAMPWLTIEGNVSFGLKIRGFSKAEIREKTKHVMDMVGLYAYKDYYPNQLSVSMLQRVAIARAFAVEPTLLLMDEPYGQLDMDLRFRMEDELLDLWRRMGTTVIFITHNIEEAVYLGQRVLVLTNKPTGIKEDIANTLEYPRNVTAAEFVELRNRVTELIKWW